MDGLTGILIMGGKSLRMNEDKAFILYGGKNMAQWSTDLLKPFCKEIIVASNKKEHRIFGDSIVRDELGAGPLAGLYSGLKHSTSEWNLVLPCDTPLIKKEVLEILLDSTEGFDAVVAVDNTGKVHPLVGIYNKRILLKIEDQIKNKKYSMMNILDQIHVNKIEFDVQYFKNINAVTDLE